VNSISAILILRTSLAEKKVVLGGTHERIVLLNKRADNRVKIISYNYINKIAPKIFNYKKALHDIDVEKYPLV
jgi:hypothetical protein